MGYINGVGATGHEAEMHGDQVLEEYLRVINSKDQQLHQLMRDLEAHRLVSRKKEGESKAKVKQLTQQLEERGEMIGQLQNQATNDNATISKLVANADALKLKIRQAKERNDELESRVGLEERAKQLAEVAVKSAQTSLQVLQKQWEEQHQELKTVSGELIDQQTAARELKQQLQAAKTSTEHAEVALDSLRREILTMVPEEQHKEALATMEAQVAEKTRQSDMQLQKLQREVKETQDDLVTTRQSLSQVRREFAALLTSLDNMKGTLEATQSELAAEQLRHREALDRHKRDEGHWKEKQREASDGQAKCEELLVAATKSADRYRADLHDMQVQYERSKATAESLQESLRNQLRSCQDELHKSREGAERIGRQLEEKDHVLIDSTAKLNRTRDEASHVQNDLREKISVLTAAVSTRKEECDRLQCELRSAHAQVVELQRSAVVQERSIAQKVEELQAGVQRLQGHLRDKEEEVRRMELVHNRDVQKAQQEHAAAVEEVKRRYDAELQDLRSRLERYRADLGEQTGGSKGLEKELMHTEEVRREMRCELDRIQSSILAKDDIIATLKREVERLQRGIMQLEEAASARTSAEAALHRQIQTAERGMMSAKSDAEAAAESVKAKTAIVQSQAAIQAKLEDDLRSKEVAMAALRHNIDAMQEAEQAAKKQRIHDEHERCKLAKSLVECEERLQRKESELKTALQEQRRLIDSAELAAEETRRLREIAAQREAECTHLSQQAKNSEEVMKKAADGLQRTIQDRDEAIAKLQAAQATILPHLNDERGKTLVLQERLQHQQEMERVQVDQLQQRIVTMEGEAAARDAAMVRLKEEKARIEKQYEDAKKKIASAEKMLESREVKYEQRKEEVVKAMQQLEASKADAVTMEKRAAEELSSAEDLRFKYKKEKAKMEAILQQAEGKMRSAEREGRAARQQVEDLSRKVSELESALHHAQTNTEARIGEVKVHYEHLLSAREASSRGAANDSAVAEQQISTLQSQLGEAQRALAASQAMCKDSQRTITAYLSVAAADYAEEVVDMKCAYMDMILRGHRSLMSRAVASVNDCWAAVQSSVSTSSDHLKHVERQLSQSSAAHRSALKMLEEEHHREMEEMAAAHETAMSKLRDAVVATERRVVSLQESLRQAGDGEQARIALLEEEVARAEQAAAKERQSRAALEEKLSAAQRQTTRELWANEEALRAAKLERDKIQRKLDDRLLEQKHNEDELRELRSEVTALQRVLKEKEEEYRNGAQGREHFDKQLTTAVTACDAAQQQTAEAQSKIDILCGKLEAARASHQRVQLEGQAEHRKLNAKLDTAQSELITVTSKNRELESKVGSQKIQIEELTKAIQLLSRQEADAAGQLQACKKELSTLREQCANLKSINQINEKYVAEMKFREQDFLEKVRESKRAESLMQQCFRKQQQEIEVGRRLRQNDSEPRALNYS